MSEKQNPVMTFRASDELRQRIKQAAEQDHRNDTGEILYLLELGFAMREQLRHMERKFSEDMKSGVIDPGKLVDEANGHERFRA